MANSNVSNINDNLEYEFETYKFNKCDYHSINKEFSAFDWSAFRKLTLITSMTWLTHSIVLFTVNVINIYKKDH